MTILPARQSIPRAQCQTDTTSRTLLSLSFFRPLLFCFASSFLPASLALQVVPIYPDPQANMSSFIRSVSSGGLSRVSYLAS